MNRDALRVPRRAHFLWTGAQFPLSNRLAVESLLQVDPEIEVALHLFGASPEGQEHFEALRRRPQITLHRREPEVLLAQCDGSGALWQVYRKIPATAFSAQSNLLRYAVLWIEGGVYLDFDILVLRSLRSLCLDECTLGTELVWRADEARVAGELAPWMIAPSVAFAAAVALRRLDAVLGGRIPARWHRGLERTWSLAQPNNAVIAAAPRSRFVAALLRRAQEVDPTLRYRLGPTLVSEVARAHPELVTLLPPEVLYFVPPSQSFRFFVDRSLQAPPQALLVHYVSSNHRRRLRALSPQALRQLPDSLFARLARQVEQTMLAGVDRPA